MSMLHMAAEFAGYGGEMDKKYSKERTNNVLMVQCSLEIQLPHLNFWIESN